MEHQPMVEQVSDLKESLNSTAIYITLEKALCSQETQRELDLEKLGILRIKTFQITKNYNHCKFDIYYNLENHTFYYIFWSNRSKI
jgi:hypothetical protein